MGLGIGLLLIAVGAILTWAVTTTESGLDASAAGAILTVVGFVGLVLSIVLWPSSTFSRAVRWGTRPGSWVTSATCLRRRAATRERLMLPISCPWTITSPLVGRSSPATRWSSVVLPLPDRPTTAVNVLLSNVR